MNEEKIKRIQKENRMLYELIFNLHELMGNEGNGRKYIESELEKIDNIRYNS